MAFTFYIEQPVISKKLLRNRTITNQQIGLSNATFLYQISLLETCSCAHHKYRENFLAVRKVTEKEKISSEKQICVQEMSSKIAVN